MVKLCSRFTDGLCRDDTHRLTNLSNLVGGQVETIALHTTTTVGLTSEGRTDAELLQANMSRRG